MLVLAAITRRRLAAVIRHLPCEPQHGRPWSCSLAQRILIISTMTPRLAALAAQSRLTDRRESWVVDGTLIPTRDHRRAARSKNYRWSCNAQVLIRRRDLRIVATTAGGPGNRNDPVHYRGSNIEALCQQHGRVLADGGYRGIPSSSRQRFAETGSYATEHGVAISSRRAAHSASQPYHMPARV